MGMRKAIALACGLLILLSISATGPAAKASVGQKLIVIVWDGAQRNHFFELYDSDRLPNLKSMVANGGGIRSDLHINSPSCVPGSGDGIRPETGPGCSTIITGYRYPEQANWITVSPHPIPAGYTFFERLKMADPSAKTGLISGKDMPSWPTIPLENARPTVDYWYQGEITGLGLTNRAIDFIGNYGTGSFFLFFHYQNPDVTGHRFGENSERYGEALRANDFYLGMIVRQLDRQGIRNSTRILVTTDHGFTEGGRLHGACSDDNRNIWIVADRASLISGNVDPHQTAIGPTLFDIFGVSKDVSPPFPAQSLYEGP